MTRRTSSAKVATAMWSASESCESIRIGRADEEEAKVSAESLLVKERMLGIPRASANGSARSSASSRIIVPGRSSAQEFFARRSFRFEKGSRRPMKCDVAQRILHQSEVDAYMQHCRREVGRFAGDESGV